MRIWEREIDHEVNKNGLRNVVRGFLYALVNILHLYCKQINYNIKKKN